MSMNRREWLIGAASTAGAAAFASLGVRAEEPARRAMPRFGMCDWSMGQMTPAAYALGKQIGLDGVQVSVGTRDNQMWLRRPEVQEQYRQAARENGMSLASLALGELNNVPLMSEPRAAIWVADAIEVARQMKAESILLAFFGKGELKGQNAEDMRRVIDVLGELAPRAEKAGVILGVESYLSAEDHLRILDAVKSKAVQVYFDVKNTADAGHDSIAAIKRIGIERICQIHFKDTPSLEQGSGKVDWPATVAALKELKYPGWIVLETPSPSKDVVADTRKNLQYAQRLFAV